MAIPTDDVSECAGDDGEVTAQAAASRIVAIYAGEASGGLHIHPPDLGQARDAGANIECACGAAGGDQLVLTRQTWPGADKAHMAGKDIQKLGQLIQFITAKGAAEAGDIVAAGFMGGPVTGA